MFTHRVARRLALALALSLAGAGCGGPRTGEVAGRITLKGKAPNLDGLTINFAGDDGRSAAAMIGPDGTFSARGVPAGPVKISLVYQSPQTEVKMSSKPPGDGTKPADPEVVRKWEESIRAGLEANGGLPDKLRDPHSSGLALTVEADKTNEFNHDVK